MFHLYALSRCNMRKRTKNNARKVRFRASLHQAALAKVLAQWRRPEVLLDDWAYDLEAATRRLGQDPDALPLIAVCDGAGRAVYSVGGYQAGSVQLIAHALAFLSQKS